MKQLYASPLRVVLLLLLMAGVGLFSGLNLPISLFPNSSKPEVGVWFSYGGLNAQEFLDSYGRSLESEFAAISTREVEAETVSARYFDDGARFEIFFHWGASSQEAKREVQNLVNSYGARMPKEIRDNSWVWNRDRNTGFLAVSYYSDKRSLEEVYELVEPILLPKVAKVQDAEKTGLYNPKAQEILIELNPSAMASLKLFPNHIANAVDQALRGHSGGSVTVGSNYLKVQMPREINSVEDLNRILIPTPSGKTVHLNDVAHVDLTLSTSHQRSFKTNGAPSLILFAEPDPDGNVKRMAEEIISHVEETQLSLPSDIHYKVLVDPSFFIRRSIKHVLVEVAIGALLAVAVLFFFVGSFRNTITALFEIPLSMVLAFCLMKLFDMNLNLISLGGLALAAGMNVDASVVVMENIFRHLEKVQGKIDFHRRLSIISQAVAEVRFPIIASTIASLVVFLPLTFTSELTYAILGDLAKAVVFSHGFAALVALIVVPTVRLYLMERWPEAPPVSPIQGFLFNVENAYAKGLQTFLDRPRLKWMSLGALALILVLQITFLLPRLPKEIIGKPDTDWMVLNVSSSMGNTQLQQIEEQAEQVEARMLAKFGNDILYTFNNINGMNNASVMARLKDKSEMERLWKEFESEFQNTPTLRFDVEPWNPAELPIPNPPDLEITVRGGSSKARTQMAKELSDDLRDQKIFERAWTNPNSEIREGVVVTPHNEQWIALRNAGVTFVPSDLADLARVATEGRSIGWMMLGRQALGIKMQLPQGRIQSAEDLGSIPVGVGEKVIPLKALASVRVSEVDPEIYQEDQRPLVEIAARLDRDEKATLDAKLAAAKKVVEDYQQRSSAGGPLVQMEDAQKELNQALSQLMYAISFSILLIFLTMVLQFSSIAHALLVLVAVPLGLIGVLTSLWVFGSTLSLNSALGVILLNGIAVANSIILVDFMKKLVAQGLAPREAAIEAARTRMRPILITSLTTVLGMMPIALGFGEGGRVLQPLGIAVSGGLWVSTLLTLFVVPVLQASYLEYSDSQSPSNENDYESSSSPDPDPAPAN